MKEIFSDKMFYHIYPLGMCACPKHNDFCCPAGNCFEQLSGELDRLVELGINALYIGPVFESSSHGYDTVDYYYIDRRLGNNQKFKDFCQLCHSKGIAVVLDAVFNHTGRDFFAFKDIILNGRYSQYTDWYVNLNFNQHSCFGDTFDYQGWAGCMDLVKLNVDNPQVQEHIFGAVKYWIEDFQIDGLRLDAADVLSPAFMDKLSSFCKSIKKDFWLMGEVVHGDYNNWVREGRLDSVTNYQLYKALWSSLNDGNMFELSYNLDREFGPNGLYTFSRLYNFVDNHDVNRVASSLKDPDMLSLLYGILSTIPGIPSIYYGSESGIKGTRGEYDDYQLRPALPPFTPQIPDFAKPDANCHQLTQNIRTFARIRKENSALRTGDYNQLFVSNLLFAFQRKNSDQRILVCINADCKPQYMNLQDLKSNGVFTDLLTEKKYSCNDLKGFLIPGKWLTILREDL